MNKPTLTYGTSTHFLNLEKGDIIIVCNIRQPDDGRLQLVTLYKYNNILRVVARPCYGFKVKSLKHEKDTNSDRNGTNVHVSKTS